MLRPEPTCQPEAVTAGLEGDYNALDPASRFLRFLMRSRRPRVFSTAGARCQAQYRQRASSKAHLDDRNQRAVRFEGREESTQVVQLLHGVLHRFASATMDAISSPPPMLDNHLAAKVRYVPRPRSFFLSRASGPAYNFVHFYLSRAMPVAWLLDLMSFGSYCCIRWLSVHLLMS